MKEIKFVLCGCGHRGASLTKNIVAKVDGVKIVGVCDTGWIDKAETLKNELKDLYNIDVKAYDNYKKMFEELNPDAVFVATSWEYHVEVATYAMEKGVAVAMEVGGAYNAEECYKLVSTYEKTKTPFMFMENCCFNKDELFVTNVVRNGLMGEIVHCHGAYAHDLRHEIAYGKQNRHYRLRNYLSRNCENYPTHELGPIAKILNINRGNRMVSLTSMASKSAGLHEYVQDKEELNELKDAVFAQGDIVKTLIKCENGELISLCLDTTLPRFYSREFTVRGTKGMYTQDNDMLLIEGDYEESWDLLNFYKNHHHNTVNYEKYLPKIWKDVTQEILDAGHGGMDYFEFVAFFDALKNGTEMPIDVYDAASWMAITYLSEISIKNGGAPVEIPDFTNGKYKTRKPKDVVEF